MAKMTNQRHTARAGFEQMVRQGRRELEPLPGPAHDGALAQARGGRKCDVTVTRAATNADAAAEAASTISERNTPMYFQVQLQ